MTDREVDLIISEHSKSTEEILKKFEQIRSSIHELFNSKEEHIKELEQEKCELLGIIQGKDKAIKDLKEDNAELKKKLKEELKTIADKDLSFVARFDALEKENAELKDENKVMADNYSKMEQKFYDNLTKAKAIIGELSKSLFLAKGIIRDLIDDTVDFKESKERAMYCYEQEKFDTYKKAEQFLKED